MALIMKLEKELALLKRQVESSTLKTDEIKSEEMSSRLVEHKLVKNTERKAYEQLRRFVQAEGPKVEIQAPKIVKASPFTSPLSIQLLDKIPSLFSVETIGEMNCKIETNAHEPAYLASSRKAFGFGVMESHFIMKSINLPHEIHFNPAEATRLFKDVIGPTPGVVRMESSKLDYVLNVFQTIFQVYLGCQFILCDVEFKALFDRNDYAGDLVSSEGMLKSQYADQDFPLLPTAGYGNLAKYVPPSIKEMFTPIHHHMQIGETDRELISGKKVMRRAGVVMDQYLAAANDLYYSYIFQRRVRESAFLEQHRVLTLPEVSVKVESPSVFQNSMVPMWQREESDGCLLLFCLDLGRQQKYFNHLCELLYSVNLVSFASAQEMEEFPPRKELNDPDIQRLLDSIVLSSNQYDFFRALSLDLMTTWIDTTIVEGCLTTGPLNAVFKVFGVLLWYCYFPSIARDNAPDLMYTLFTAVSILSRREVENYVLAVGFSDVQGRTGTIQRYPKEDYLNGRVHYPLLQARPVGAYPNLRIIHDLLVMNPGVATPTADSASVQTPRMVNLRQLFQPYVQIPSISNNPADGENPNQFATLLGRVMTILINLVTMYKSQYRNYTNKSAFGNSQASVSQLLGYFNNHTASILNSIGIRGHAEMFCLRTLGANSPYVLDCQNLGREDYELRPQVLFQNENGDWKSIMMQRLQEKLPFELPIFLFLSLRGAESLDSITPPDSNVQYENLQHIQEEGILCGDVIRFINLIKFDQVGVLRHEALGISNVITAARSDRIFVKLSELAQLAEFKDLFSILINVVGTRIDNRAVNFKIAMQAYNSARYDPGVPQPQNELYNANLRLGRELMGLVLNTISPIFVPESSPISLYLNGLAAVYSL